MPDNPRGWLTAQIRPDDGAPLPEGRMPTAGARLATYARDTDAMARKYATQLRQCGS